MRGLVTLGVLVALSACTERAEAPPTNTVIVDEPIRNGGPCRDGTRPQEDEKCK